MSDISEENNSNKSESPSEENSYLKKDDEDLELELKEKEKKEKSSYKTNKKLKSKDKEKSNSSLEKEDVSPKRFPIMRKHARNISNYSSSSSDEYNIKIKTDLANNYFQSLTEFQKSQAKSEKEIFDNNFTVLKNDYKIIEEYESLIFKDTCIDIMFIMDLTGSMGGFLSEAKRSIRKITEEINDNNPGSKIRLSFIGYRDYDTEEEQRNYEIINFTEDIENFITRIRKFECYGGGDQPEDVAGALNEALKMDWKSNAKYVVLVCDAPCHGSQYHDIYIDTFKEGDPAGYVIEDLMQKFKGMDITFYCMEINKSTSKMFDIMKCVYNDPKKFDVEKIGSNYENLSFFVAFSASELLGNTKYDKCDFIQVLEKCRKESIEKIMKKYSQNNNINNNNDETLTQSLINEIDNMNLDGDDKKLVQFINRMNNLNIDNNKIDIQDNKIDNYKKDFIDIEFTEKEIIENLNKDIDYIIHGLTYNKNNKKSFNSFTDPLIIEQKFNTNITVYNINNEISIGSKENNIIFSDNKLCKDFNGIIPKRIEKKYLEDFKLLTKKYCYDDLICEQIADYFNLLLQSETNSFIKFKKNVIYQQEGQNFEKLKFIIVDVSIPFSVIEPLGRKILQAFSHFSYQVSLGELIILNMEYNSEKKNIDSYEIFYRKDNGYKNILKFFSNHVCSSFCKYLNLVHPRKKSNHIEINEQFFSKKFNSNFLLCKSCCVPIRKSYIKNYNDLFCYQCSYKKLKSLKKVICEECHQLFDCFSFEYNSILENYPTKCKNCRNLIFE